MVTESKYVMKGAARNQGTIKIDLDPKLWLVLLAFCEKNIVRYALLVFSMIPVLGGFSSAILATLYIVLILLCMNKSSHGVGIKESCVLIFTVSAVVISCLAYPENAKFILEKNNFWNTIFPCLRWYIVGLFMIPNDKTMRALGKASCIGILIESAFVLLYMLPNGLLGTDEMSRAYQLLPNILIVVNYAFNEKRILPWLFAGTGLVYLFAMGTRGALVVFLAFAFIKFLTKTSTKGWIRVFIGVVSVGIGAIILNSTLYIVILEGLKDMFSAMGLSTRIIDFAIEGTMISYTSDRDIIFKQAMQVISERPLIGYGVWGDWPIFNWSCHNMYLEVMIHFGVIGGILLMLWMIITTGKAYFNTSNAYAKDMILIFACFVFVRGIFGGSWLYFGTMFMIAFCIKEFKRNQQQKRLSI